MKGNLKIDTTLIANALYDPYEKHVELAVVFGEDDNHYTIETNDGKNTDVYIECQLIPTGTEITARLCSIGNGRSTGIYRIPRPGTEVVVVFPGGSVENPPYIVSIGNTISQEGDDEGKGIPDELDADTLVIINDKATIIVSETGDITINAKDGNVFVNASDQVEINGNDKKIAYKDGAVDSGTLYITTVSGVVTAISYAGAGQPAPPTGVALPINAGKITDGSGKAKVGI